MPCVRPDAAAPGPRNRWWPPPAASLSPAAPTEAGAKAPPRTSGPAPALASIRSVRSATVMPGKCGCQRCGDVGGSGRDHRAVGRKAAAVERQSRWPAPACGHGAPSEAIRVRNRARPTAPADPEVEQRAVLVEQQAVDHRASRLRSSAARSPPGKRPGPPAARYRAWPPASQKATTHRSSCIRKSSTAARKSASAARARRLADADPGRAQKHREDLVIGSKPAQRLNCQHLSGFCCNL